MAKGAAWLVGLRLAMRGLGLISIIILARLLTPEDFGVVAMAMLLMRIAEAVAELRPEWALIQNTRAERKHYDTVWTMTVLRGAVMAVLLVLAARPGAVFFNEPRVEVLSYVIAVGVFIEGFSNVGVADFFKNLTLQKTFRFNLASRIGSFSTTVILAFALRNYWALVGGFVAYRVFFVIFSYAFHPYRPRFSLAAWREILGFSKWLLAHNLFVAIAKRSDIFFIGKFVDATSLGMYTVARRVSGLSGGEFVGPVRNAIFPAYAKLAQEPEKLRESFIEGYGMIMLIGTPIALGIAVIAEPLVTVAFGVKWLAAVPLIQVLAIDALANVASANSASLFLAVGRPWILATVQGIQSALIVPMLLWLVLAAGAYGAAWAVAGTSALLMMLSVGMALRLLGLSPLRLLGAVWRTIGAAAAMAAAVLTVQSAWVGGEGMLWSLAELLACVAAGAAAYIGAQLLLWWLAGLPTGPEGHLLAALRAKLAPALAAKGS